MAIFMLVSVRDMKRIKKNYIMDENYPLSTWLQSHQWRRLLQNQFQS